MSIYKKEPFTALSGILFPGNEEAAFSNFRFLESIGSVVAYAISPLLCMHIKLWLLIALIVTGLLGYTLVEHLERRRTRTQTVSPVKRKDSEVEATSF